MQKAVDYLLEKHRTADGMAQIGNQKEQEEQYIATVKQQIEKIDEFVKNNQDKIGKSGKSIQSNITDNERAKIKTSKGVIQGYDGGVAVHR